MVGWGWMEQRGGFPLLQLHAPQQPGSLHPLLAPSPPQDVPIKELIKPVYAVEKPPEDKSLLVMLAARISVGVGLATLFYVLYAHTPGSGEPGAAMDATLPCGAGRGPEVVGWPGGRPRQTQSRGPHSLPGRARAWTGTRSGSPSPRTPSFLLEHGDVANQPPMIAPPHPRLGHQGGVSIQGRAVRPVQHPASGLRADYERQRADQCHGAWDRGA